MCREGIPLKLGMGSGEGAAVPFAEKCKLHAENVKFAYFPTYEVAK